MKYEYISFYHHANAHFVSVNMVHELIFLKNVGQSGPIVDTMGGIQIWEDSQKCDLHAAR